MVKHKRRKTTSRKIRRRKLYNPFKMWGSYVGVVIGFIVGLFSGNIRYEELISEVFENTVLPSSYQSLVFFSIYLSYISIGIIIGFLIGWGIHSLFRRLMR